VASSNTRPDSGGEMAGEDGPNLARAAVVIVVAVVLGILLLQVGSRPVAHLPGSTAAAASSTTTSAPTTTTTINRANVHVLVANGTSTAEGATDYANELHAQGWATLPPADTTTPATASNVYYSAGNQAAAAALANELGLKPAAVQPLSTTVPVSSVAGADLVLVLGPDLASRAPTTTST